MRAHMHFVVGHAQTRERLADLVGSERAAAIPVEVRKRRRKVLLLQQGRKLSATGGDWYWRIFEHMARFEATLGYIQARWLPYKGLCGTLLLSLQPWLECA